MLSVVFIAQEKQLNRDTECSGLLNLTTGRYMKKLMAVLTPRAEYRSF